MQYDIYTQLMRCIAIPRFQFERTVIILRHSHGDEQQQRSYSITSGVPALLFLFRKPLGTMHTRYFPQSFSRRFFQFSAEVCSNPLKLTVACSAQFHGSAKTVLRPFSSPTPYIR
ncbi:hypothetical protein FHG87_009473 [Trinorchestia longiramus]|nr:hypothetical protein FHG87_009473 [Trinorchestia longiramus]